MSHIIIRKATIEDIIPLALLARVTFREAFGHLFIDNQNLIDYFALSFSIEAMTNELNDNNNVFWLAFSDGLPVGYAKLIKNSLSKFINDISASELHRIYVLNDFLNQKIGQKLLNFVFREVNQIESNNLWLSVYKDNLKAIKFYKRFNYSHLGYHTFSILKQSFKFSVMNKTF